MGTTARTTTLLLICTFSCSCARPEDSDHRQLSEGSKSSTASDSLAAQNALNLGTIPITRPIPLPANTFSFIGNVDPIVEPSSGSDKVLMLNKSFGKTYYGLNIDDMGVSKDKKIKNLTNSGIGIDFNSARARITIPSGTPILDESGQPTILNSLLRKRVNVRAFKYELTKEIYTLKDPIFLITASQIQILPDVDTGSCLWNTSNFASVSGGCKDLQTNNVWNTTQLDFFYNQTCNLLNNAKIGGLTNWDLPSVDELKQISGLNAGVSHFNPWSRYGAPPGSMESNLTPGLGSIGISAKLPASLVTYIPADILETEKIIMPNFNAPYWSREGKIIDLYSGTIVNKPIEKLCGPLQCDHRYSDRATALCISRPGGVVPAAVIGSGPASTATSTPAPNTPPAVKLCKLDDGVFQSVPENGGCEHIPSQTAWSKAFSDTFNYEDALSKCESLSENTFSDWALPDQVQFTNVAGAAKAGSHFNFSTADRNFWVKQASITKNNGLTIDLGSGATDSIKVSKKASVVCVRKATLVIAAATPTPTTLPGTYNPNNFRRVPPLYLVNSKVTTPVGFNLADMAAEFEGQDVIVTGQIVFQEGLPKLVGHIQYKAYYDSRVTYPIGVDAQFMVWSLANGSKARVVRDSSVSLEAPVDASQITSLSGAAITDIQQLANKKVQVRTRISRTDFNENTGTLRALKIKQVPVATGECSYESDRFQTVAEGCLVDGKRVFWTGLNFASTSRIDGTAPYFYPKDQPITNAPSQSTDVLCTGLGVGAGATICGDNVATYNVALVTKQLNSGFDIPDVNDWISYLNSIQGNADHLFQVPLSAKEFQTTAEKNIWLRDSKSIVAQDGGGSIFATKATVNPKILAGSWTTLLGQFNTSDLQTYGYPKTTGVSMRLYESKPVKNVTVKSYFYIRDRAAGFPAGVNPDAFRSFGLFARYRGPANGSTNADSNMYAAHVEYNGTFTATIWRNVNGVLTKIASAPMSNPLQTYSSIFKFSGLTTSEPTAGGLLTFSVIDNQLVLKYTDQNTFTERTILTTTDNSISEAGLTGVRMIIAEDPYPSFYVRSASYGSFSAISGD